MTVEVALPHWLAEQYGAQIAAVDTRVRLKPIHGAHPDDPDLAATEILLHGFWFGLTPVADVLPHLPSLRWVHTTGAGVDDLVSPELVARGVRVTNVSGAYAPAMAEYALAAMVLLARGFDLWTEAQRDQRWLDRERPSGVSLRGKTVGLVGYGSVSRHLAPACRALGMTVWATRRTPRLDASESVDRFLAADELDELLGASDFVVLGVSLNSTTRHLIGERELRAMKPGAFLVNVTRGEVVDQPALVRALREGQVGGAVLDVTDPEPLPSDDPLWEAPHAWITPHVSGDTPEGWQAGIDLFCDNLRLYLAGHPERMGNLLDLSAYL